MRSFILPLPLAVVLFVVGAAAQESGGKPATRAGMNERCRQMMSMHDSMMAEMKAMDASLDQKIAAMNAAKGEARVNAMAAVITEMAAQRKQQRETMSGMRDQMMTHMSGHMAQSGGAGGRQAMIECPMMKGAREMHAPSK